MPHHLDLILTLTGGLTAALFLGFLTQKLRLSPIVGYLLAGILVGPFTPGFVADRAIAEQCAEIGVILLMFGVGLHFHLADLLAVRRIAIPGALVQILVATILGALVTHAFGWSWAAGIVFGLAISVASTVVLTRVLADHRALHTPIGHIAIGWLIVEDLFTILVLVLLPALFGAPAADAAAGVGGMVGTLAIAIGKVVLLIGFTLVAGQRLIPLFLGYVARTGSRELFTLTVLVLALGIAVGAAKFFGASMALGAFLAGMVVGQSEFSARAASDALPMRDAFAVLFFVSVGMLFDPNALGTSWPLLLATFAVVVIGKPLAAVLVVLAFKRPLTAALSIGIALAQIGEFSFILSGLALSLKLMPDAATNALVGAAILSITINPLLYQSIKPLIAWLEQRGFVTPSAGQIREGDAAPRMEAGTAGVIVVGYGPIGRTLSRILRENGLPVVVVETNLDTVRELLARGENAVYGDATQPAILEHAGIERAESLILAASGVAAAEVVEAARALNPDIRILTRSTYLRETPALLASGAHAVFSSEGEIALSMTEFLLAELGATGEQIERESRRVREEFFSRPEATERPKA